MQGLTERVGVPCGAGTRLEAHERAADARRRRRLDDRVLPDGAGERLRRARREGVEPNGLMSMAAIPPLFARARSTD